VTTATGQTLRRLGLLVEAACVLGLLADARGRLPHPGRLPFDPGLALGVGLGFGFCLWMAGTLAIYWPSRHRNVRRGDSGGEPE
jgi:hypothetical protein